MIALRSGKNKIGHEHYVDAIAEVQAKKKDVSIAFTRLPMTRTLTCATRPSISMLKATAVRTRDIPRLRRNFFSFWSLEHGQLGTDEVVLQETRPWCEKIDACTNTHEQSRSRVAVVSGVVMQGISL